jgi:hypothetical protein
VVSSGADFREAAARKWLELSAEDREKTALYASGRGTRAHLNALVQDGLKAEGSLRGEGLAISRLESVNLTREEMRYASNYRSGQVLEVIGRDRPAGLERGTYDVVGVSAKGVVSLRDTEGKRIRFRPDRLDPMTSATIWLCLSAKPCAFTKAIAFAGPPMTRREACSIPPRPMWSPSHVRCGGSHK